MSDPRCWKNPLIPADTRVQIADGEIERLRVCLSKANEQAEHFEREWYLRGDELEQLRAELAASREREARMRDALIDCRTCRNYTRDGCIQTAQCVNGDGYRRATTVRFWSAALAEGAQG